MFKPEPYCYLYEDGNIYIIYFNGIFKRFIDAPVDFEDVTLTKSSSDAEFINALKAVKRNRIVLKSRC